MSPPRKRRSQSKTTPRKLLKTFHHQNGMIGDDNPNEAAFNDLSQECNENVTIDEEKRLSNERSKRSSAFQVALKNM